MEFIVTVQVSVETDSAQEAARLALEDLRDQSLGPWSMDVSSPNGTETVSTDGSN